MGEIVCVRGDSFTISGNNGNIVPGGDLGLYVRDTRFLNRLQVLIDGTPPVHLAGTSTGGYRAVFDAYVPATRDTDVDPTVAVTRRRLVDGGLREDVDLANGGTEPVDVTVSVRVGCDFAYIFEVKHGRVLPAVPPEQDGEVVRFRRPGGTERTTVRLEGAGVASGADGELGPTHAGSAFDEEEDLVSGSTDEIGVLRTGLTIPPGETRTATIVVTVEDRLGESAPGPNAATELRAPVTGVVGPAPQGGPELRCSDSRLTRLVRRSINDLRSLELQDPQAPENRFVAAGSPWFLTLFGRDSIWAAFMALPYDLDLARGTLRVLARRQGSRVDMATEEEPGKILHEVRRGALAERGDLPPFYYGTVDATPLFVVLAHEAWRCGLPDDDLRALLPNIEAALRWIVDYGDPDGDGFVEYVPKGERTLANQGWKDSADGVRYLDGRIATAPLALCEVQGYAYDAAMRGADLLDRFGSGGQHWRDWATGLRERFADCFWVADDAGSYPAIALDGDGKPVDGIASNMGHLLATGILDADGTARVAERLTGPDMAPGWGLRTLSSRSGGFNPLSYHCGTIWPHDTAIAVWGLAATGHGEAASTLLRGLVRAAPSFNYRLPELFAGYPSDHAPHPVPYPAACQPQAWAAGGALLLARALLGFDANVPDGRVTFRPMAPFPHERFEVRGLPLAGGTIDARVRDGELEVELHGPAAQLVVDRP